MTALRRRVSISAIGSVICCSRYFLLFTSYFLLFTYQLLFVTPAISPCNASLRKQRRHSANLRRYARGRPHRWQRLRRRILNFGGFCSFAIFAVVAILFLRSSSTVCRLRFADYCLLR